MKEELQENQEFEPSGSPDVSPNSSISPVPGRYRVMRRNGKVTTYDLSKIIVAMTKAFLSVEGSSAAASTRIHNEVESLANKVDSAIRRRFPEGGVVHIEDIQDQVELAIMRAGYQDVARAYVIYREERAQARSQNQIDSVEDLPIKKSILLEDGSTESLDISRLRLTVSECCSGIDDVSEDLIYEAIDKNISVGGLIVFDEGHKKLWSERFAIQEFLKKNKKYKKIFIDKNRQPDVMLKKIKK